MPRKSSRARRARMTLVYLSFAVSFACVLVSASLFTEGRPGQALIGWILAAALYLAAWTEGRK